jgi:DNA-binding Lrp family transcriptional regulator
LFISAPSDPDAWCGIISPHADGGVGRENEPMKTIFVMVKCELAKAYEVADQLMLNVEEASEVHSISGQYDLLVKCYLSDDKDIGHFVTEHLQTVAGVKDTFTLIAFKAFGAPSGAER